MNKFKRAMWQLKKQMVMGLFLSVLVAVSYKWVEKDSALFIQSKAAVQELFAVEIEKNPPLIEEVEELQSIKAEDLKGMTYLDQLQKKAQDTLNYFLRGLKQRRRKKQELSALI